MMIRSTRDGNETVAGISEADFSHSLLRIKAPAANDASMSPENQDNCISSPGQASHSGIMEEDLR